MGFVFGHCFYAMRSFAIILPRKRERELIALFLLPSVISVLCLPHDGVN